MYGCAEDNPPPRPLAPARRAAPAPAPARSGVLASVAPDRLDRDKCRQPTPVALAPEHVGRREPWFLVPRSEIGGKRNPGRSATQQYAGSTAIAASADPMPLRPPGLTPRMDGDVGSQQRGQRATVHRRHIHSEMIEPTVAVDVLGQPESVPVSAEASTCGVAGEHRRNTIRAVEPPRLPKSGPSCALSDHRRLM